MKITQTVLLTAALLASSSAFAYSLEDQNKQCHKPKFTDFTLKEYNANENNEVPAEAEFSFKLQAFTNPDSIKMTVKNQPLPFTIESNSSFHKINAKIPADYSGKFLRIDARAKVTDGECYETTGWLLKVANKTGATAPAATPAPAEAPKAEAPAPAPSPAPAEAPKAEAPAPAATPAPTETPKPVSVVAPSETAKPVSITATIAPATEAVELVCVEKPKNK